MKKYIIIILLLALFISSCNDSNISKEEEYAKPTFKEHLQVRTVDLNKDFIFSGGSIKLFDTLIICAGETDINNKGFHVFSKNTGAYINSFGSIGQGPGEMAREILQFNVDTKDKVVYGYDTGQMKFFSFSIRDVLDNNTGYAKEMKMPYEYKNIRSGDFMFLKNDEFIIAYSKTKRFIKTSLTDTIASLDTYPKLHETKEFEKVERSYFWYLGRMAVKPDGSRIVHATKSGSIMEIFDCSGNTIIPLHTLRFFKPKYRVSGRNSNFPFVRYSKKAVNGITNVFCTDKYIYAKYNGYKGEDKLFKIAVFDWEGNGIKLLKIKDRFISLAVDEKTKTGYALAIDKDDNIKLVKLKLP